VTSSGFLSLPPSKLEIISGTDVLFFPERGTLSFAAIRKNGYIRYSSLS